MSQSFTEAEIPPNLCHLKNLDSLFRCPICFDYLDISMMVQHCSHNFCSLCIRKFLSYKLKCPVCNSAVTESDLRNNRILDDLVKTFQLARHQLLRVNFESPPVSPKTPLTSGKLKQENSKGPSVPKMEGTIMSCFFQKGKSSSPSDVPKPQNTHQDDKVNEDRFNRTVKEEPEELPTISSASYSPELPSTSTEVKPVIKVECPVCGVGVLGQHINKHLDSCLTRDEKKESLRSSVSRRKNVAKVVYDLLSERELKKRLKDLNLPTYGSRQQLIKRHQEFVHVYNAQCDSLNPKSAQEIAKEVERNEKLKTQLEGKSKSVMVFSKNQTEEEIDELHSKYRKQHKDEFSQLIAQVRGRCKKKQVKQEPEEETDHERECSTESAEVSHEDNVTLDHVPVPPSPSVSEVSISSSRSNVFSSDSADESKDNFGETPPRKRKICRATEGPFIQNPKRTKEEEPKRK
ncbi:E3 ubiquitin-protein ligase RAD18 isoform X1 [Lepisosteus oculatus]|uniref:E3 ubiquitin-protein ligase RAD18 isoform X1 n=1 Tax=Lepisosteus oculatus TaxID=7918 RepID=UPI00371B3FB0